MTIDVDYRMQQFMKDVSEYKSFCTPGANILVDAIVDTALTKNFGRLNVGTAVMGLHRTGALVCYVDPVFEAISEDDIMAAYQIGSYIDEERSFRPSVAKKMKAVLRLSQGHAGRRLINEGHLLTAILESDCSQTQSASRFELLHGLADLRSGEPKSY